MLAEQIMTLHQAAQGVTPADATLMVARNALDTARAELRENVVALRSQLVHLVSLASHFPELLAHKDVQRFMSTDGLQTPDHRQLADYDDVRSLTRGRNELLLAKYDGVDVCLKRFPVQGDMRAYQHELLRVQRLRHPFIIRYTAVFQDNGSMYLEMEYFPLGSLRHWVETTQPDAAKIRSVLRQVLLGLACMHSQNIVHCDIKPENVLVADDNTPRICDFEMSKDLDAILSSTMGGGTLRFTAPEILIGKAKPSPASDMYAFGLLILNTVCQLGPGDTYPLTDASKAPNSALKDLIAWLLSENPATRPSAVQLQAELYFADDGVAEVTQQLRGAQQELADAHERVTWAQTDAERRLAAKQAEAARHVLDAQQAVTQAREQSERAQSDAERRLAEHEQQAAVARADEATRLEREADARVANAKRQFQQQLAAEKAEAARHVQDAQQAVTQAREQSERAQSDAERRLAEHEQQAAVARVDEATRLEREADARVKKARDTEQHEITLREADLALEQGVRWLCEGTYYHDDNARILEQAFQRLRLFLGDAHTGNVKIFVKRVSYRVNVSLDGVGMMQSRPDTGRRRPVRREEPLLAPLRTETTALKPCCDAWAEIEARVQESLPRHVVTKLEKIDNNQLLADFDRQMKIVAAKPANAARADTVAHRANVRFGFHAMAGKPAELKKIYEGGRADGGFDYRLGRQGAYGRGSYFAEHAIYSAYLFPCPAKAADSSIVLLVADVILGQSKDLGKGMDGTLLREPPIEGGVTGDVYDSVQGTEGSFGIHGPPGLHHPRQDARRYGRNPKGEEEYGRQYIVYDKAKAYPRYLVTIRPQ
jgi:hypothetical protein